MTQIVGVAFQVEDQLFYLTKPYRHHHIVGMLSSQHNDLWKNARKTGTYVQGFVVVEEGASTMKFVDRKTAAKIAFETKLIPSEVDELFSEDLW
jgi:hypothetical protein